MSGERAMRAMLRQHGVGEVNRIVLDAMPLDPGKMLERHFTVSVLSELWGLSCDVLQRWFEEEPGVLKIGNSGDNGKRRKITLRIPESIAWRVYRERTK